MDIIEIDAASNRRIDEIRELRDKIYVAPTSLKYKVYIIDEVHMLTREAFNALLKTLEEPPAHAVFILATTDAHKLPETIISRTQRFTFRPVETEKVAAHLADIAKKEKIKVTPEALHLLAEHGEGSFRDSISLLDQLGSHEGKVDVADVQKLLGVPSSEAVDGVLAALGDNSTTADLMNRLDALFADGYQPAGIAKQLGRRLRQQLIDGRTVLSPQETLELLGELIKVPLSHDPERFLEVVLLRMRPQAERITKVSAEAVSTPPARSGPVEPVKQKAPEKSVSKTAKAEPRPQPGNAPFNETVWPQVLQVLKQKHNTLYGVIRMAQPAFQAEDTLVLSFAFAFHEKRLKESSNREKLSTVIYELTGRKVSVECRLDPEAKPPQASDEAHEAPPDKPAPDESPRPDIAAISNIFGATELLES
jgi:DNA polymerase-3 subunit gamma/tau